MVLFTLGVQLVDIGHAEHRELAVAECVVGDVANEAVRGFDEA